MKTKTLNVDSSNTMAFRYLLVLGMLTVLCTASYKIIEKITERLEDSASLVRTSSRQTMLSERIANLSHDLVSRRAQNKITDIREQLDNTVDMMEASHKALVHGSEELSLPGNPSPVVSKIFFQEPVYLDSIVYDYISRARDLANTPESGLSPGNPDYLYIISAKDNILRGMNEVLNQYQIESKWYMKRLRFLEAGVFIAFISLLFLMGLLVFYPMIKRIQKEMNKLKETEEYTREILQTAADGVISADANGDIKSFNRAAERMFGYSSVEAMNKNIKTLISVPDEADVSIKHMKSGEKIGHHSRGSTFPVELSVSDTHLNKKFIYICVIRDITGRKRAEEALLQAHDTLEIRVKERTSELTKTNALLKQEIVERENAQEALRESERRFRTMADTAPVMIWMAGPDKLNSYFNKVWLEFRGRKLEHDIGNGWIEGVYPDDRQKVMETRNTAFLKRQEFKIEYRLKKADGQYQRVLDHGTPRFLPDGNFAGFVGSAIDITDRQKSEVEDVRAQKLDSLGSLAGGMVHDFNNLLTSIMSNATLARKYVKVGDAVFDRLLDIEKSSLRAKKLTQKFLTFSKGGEPVKKTMSIVNLLKQAGKEEITGPSFALKFSIPASLWMVDVDELQISQVINNLVRNAMESMPGGGEISLLAENVRVNRDKQSLDSSRNYVKISVRDNGCGIPELNLKKIFDPYFTTKRHSSGLGLATSYSIIKKHGGFLTVDSGSGKGATFYVYLPAALKRQVGATERVGTVPANGNGHNGASRVLVMDDERVTREEVGKALSYIGYTVAFAEDGAKAVELYSTAKKNGGKFDAVILDLSVPGGMGGEETVKRLLEIDPGVKAIASIGKSDSPVISQCRDQGFIAAVSKPYNIDNLKNVLSSVVRTH